MNRNAKNMAKRRVRGHYGRICGPKRPKRMEKAAHTAGKARNSMDKMLQSF